MVNEALKIPPHIPANSSFADNDDDITDQPTGNSFLLLGTD